MKKTSLNILIIVIVIFVLGLFACSKKGEAKQTEGILASKASTEKQTEAPTPIPTLTTTPTPTSTPTPIPEPTQFPQVRLDKSILEIENTGERTNIHEFLSEMCDFLFYGADNELALELLENVKLDSSDYYTKWFLYKGGIERISIILLTDNNNQVTNVSFGIPDDASTETNNAMQRLFLAALYSAAIDENQVTEDLERMFDAGGYESFNGYKLKAEHKAYGMLYSIIID